VPLQVFYKQGPVVTKEKTNMGCDTTDIYCPAQQVRGQRILS